MGWLDAYAVRAFADGDLVHARYLLNECLSLCGDESDDARSTLIRELGDVELAAGNRERGVAYFHTLIVADPGSPLPRLMFARALVRHAQDHLASLEQITLAEGLLNSPSFPVDDQELPRRYYEEELASLNAEVAALRDKVPN